MDCPFKQVIANKFGWQFTIRDSFGYILILYVILNVLTVSHSLKNYLSVLVKIYTTKIDDVLNDLWKKWCKLKLFLQKLHIDKNMFKSFWQNNIYWNVLTLIYELLPVNVLGKFSRQGYKESEVVSLEILP